MQASPSDAVLTATLRLLQSATLDPQSGTELINDWLTVLRQTDGVEPVAVSLENLRDEISSSRPGIDKLRVLLDELSQYTANYARNADGQSAGDLQRLSDSLQQFGSQLQQI